VTAVDAPGAGQRPVDIDHHTGIARPRAQFIGGDQMLDGGLQKANLGLQQIDIGSRDRVVAQGRLLSSPLLGARSSRELYVGHSSSKPVLAPAMCVPTDNQPV